MPVIGHFLDPQQPQYRTLFDKISENVFGSQTLVLYTGSTFLGWKKKSRAVGKFSYGFNIFIHFI